MKHLLPLTELWHEASTGKSGFYDKLLGWGVLRLRDVGLSPSALVSHSLPTGENREIGSLSMILTTLDE